ncbi:MAG TPA: ubiquinol-cytochrome C chaperone family protein [Sphingomicrobium sp.]|nr:ubiquinol-cytochrome C chaperone family protein [Sphingomicrobium sp.]
MLRFLFRGLTTENERGRPLFEAATALAREPHWYVEGAVQDTLDGRFAVLSTIIALIMTRLEREGHRGDLVSVALTERFIEVMESEHRELGLGDPTLGKTVRKLVAILARRTQLWRKTDSHEEGWNEATHESLYRTTPSSAALRHSADALARIEKNLAGATLDQLEQGQIR